MAGAIVAGRIENLHQHFSGTRRTTARLDQPRPIEQWTAQQLGVHPAIRGTDAPDTDGAFVLPGYVERDHDHRLRDHLLNTARSEQAALLLVRGTSCSGKTRTALEAVRTCLPGWNLVFPKTAEGLLALLEVGGPAPRTVLWLNEAQNHLRGTAGEEAAAALQSRLEKRGPVVVLGTLWPEYYRGFTTPPRSGGVTKDDEHRNARALLAQAVLVDVPASFTSESLKDPLVNRDPSLAAAARSSTGGRILQTLAAGPQLVDHYQQATEPHGPYGQAVITAAMDARRLGHASPLPAVLLEAAAPGYLTEQQRADADPDAWFAPALAYAREKIKAVAAALEPVASPDGMGPAPGLFRLNDYLDHHARTTRRYALPPASFWTAVRDHAASPPDLNAVAHQAMSRLRNRIAADLYQQAADAGDPVALSELARLRERMGDSAGAERLAQQAAGAGRTDALRELAHRRESAGDAAGAERLLQRAAEAGDHPALSMLAWQRRRAGDIAGAELLWQRAADAGHSFALPELGQLREQVGDVAGALLVWQQVAETGEPSALVALGRLHWAAGDVASAERMFQRAADAGLLYALRDWGRLRAQAGDVAGAVLVYRRAADAGDPEALQALGKRYEEAGDSAGAEQFWQRAADAGFVEALLEMTWRRRAAGDLAGAERFAQRAADAGAPSALTELGQLHWAYGDVEAAERLFQHAADARDREALSHLMLLREESGDAAGAVRLAQRAADAGDHSLLRELAIHRDTPWSPADAEPLWQQIADAGDPSALVALGRLRERARDTVGAERLWQLAADAGNWEALSELARQRGQADGMSVMDRVRRFGLEADGSPATPW
ncbi:hypothetical protein [Streptomyces aureus]|uniref:hypothetical protein n=1 Tax=Streptomyces aureus TaxID=193461 RepID=UPI0007C64CCF|nr:hypothetical protein [Streptomyces aureus]